MNILIISPLASTQSGGPAQYAKRLEEELSEKGHLTESLSFAPYMKSISGVRHLRFFFRVFRAIKNVDAVIVLDTFSVALPSVAACLLRRKKVIVRTGGDFVWEHYVNRTGEHVLLSEFYTKKIRLSLKERCITFLQKHIVVRFATCLVFSTTWQRNIWEAPYSLRSKRTSIVENAYRYEKHTKEKRNSMDIVWIGRDIPLKNVDTLRAAHSSLTEEYPSVQLCEYSDIPHAQVIEMLERARVLVIPSISEVSPNLVFEAFAAMTPVILTNDCGLHHILDGLVTWIDPREEQSIKMALLSHLDDISYLHTLEHVESYSPTRGYAEVAEDFLVILGCPSTG